MGNKNKSKGTYHEKWFVTWLQAIGIKAKRQPLSGSLGGEYSGDIKLEIRGHELVGEVKYRDTSGFPSPYTVLEKRDIAFYKRRRGTPQVVVIMPEETFIKLMENKDELTDSTDPGSPGPG
jgi:Holliday junction resolvase